MGRGAGRGGAALGARGVPLQNDEGGEDVVVLWACDDGGLLDRWAHVQSCACAAVSVARAEAAVVAGAAEADATGGGVDGAACDRLAGAIPAETTRPPTDASAFISLGWVRAKNVGAAATLRRVTNGVVGRWARACDVAPYLADRDGLALAPRAAAAAEPLPGALPATRSCAGPAPAAGAGAPGRRRAAVPPAPGRRAPAPGGRGCRQGAARGAARGPRAPRGDARGAARRAAALRRR